MAVLTKIIDLLCLESWARAGSLAKTSKMCQNSQNVSKPPLCVKTANNSEIDSFDKSALTAVMASGGKSEMHFSAVLTFWRETPPMTPQPKHHR